MEIELSTKQCEFINKATHRWNGKIGATQCGKTFIDISYVIANRIFERKGKKGLYLILGVTKETIERNVLEPMRDFWGVDLISDINSRNIAMLFGERVYCLGAEKISQVSKLRGAKFKYAYCDEIVEFNEEVFTLLKSRLSLEYSVCDFTGNPSYPNHFVKKFIDSDADVYCQQWTLYDNPFLPESYVKSLETEYAGTVYFDRYILGKWIPAEGAIYRIFTENHKKHIKPFDNKLNGFITIGVDFGGTKSATTFTAAWIPHNYSHVHYLESERHAIELDPDKLNALYIKFIKKIIEKYKITPRICLADSAEQILIRGLITASSKAGIYTPIKDSLKGQVNDRIRAFLSLMGANRFFIQPECKTLIDALDTAVWDSKALDDERLDNNTSDIDSLDSAEYCIVPYIKQLVAYRMT